MLMCDFKSFCRLNDASQYGHGMETFEWQTAGKFIKNFENSVSVKLTHMAFESSVNCERSVAEITNEAVAGLVRVLVDVQR